MCHARWPELGQQLLDVLLNLGESRNERLAIHIMIFHDNDWIREQFLTRWLSMARSAGGSRG